MPTLQKRSVMKHEISAGGIIFHRIAAKQPKQSKSFRILLIKDSYNRWALPKGHVGDEIKGETPEQAALRESSEETGLPLKDLKIIEKLGEVKYIFQLHGQPISKIVHFYLIESASIELKPQEEEVKGAEWFKPDSAVEKIEYNNSKDLMKRAVERIESL